MRILALDIGDVRIGVALSDASATIASPLDVISTKEALADTRVLGNILTDYEVGCVVVGLPRSLDGEEGQQARRVRSLAGKLLDSRGLPVEYVDERYSSVEAKRMMASQGLSERDMRGHLDKVAASIFLQGYLDSHKEHGIEKTD